MRNQNRLRSDRWQAYVGPETWSTFERSLNTTRVSTAVAGATPARERKKPYPLLQWEFANNSAEFAGRSSWYRTYYPYLRVRCPHVGMHVLLDRSNIPSMKPRARDNQNCEGI